VLMLLCFFLSDKLLLHKSVLMLVMEGLERREEITFVVAAAAA
jgi:hypothetical protein